MKTSALIKLIVWLAVAIILVVILVGGIGKGLNFWDKLPQLALESLTYDDSELYSVGSADGVTALDTAGVQALEIGWVSDSVTVSAYDGAQIVCTETGIEGRDEGARLHYLVKDGVLHLQYASAQWLAGSQAKSLQVQVPRQLAANLSEVSVDSTSATVTLSELTAQQLSIDNTSGAIQGQGLTCQSLDLDSVSGSITLDDLNAADSEIDTISGSCTLSGSLDKLDFSSTSAACTVTSNRCPSQIDSDSVSGSFTLTIPADSGFTAELDSVSGQINCDLPAQMHGDQLLVGSGQAHFSFDSTSGGVNIHAL